MELHVKLEDVQKRLQAEVTVSIDQFNGKCRLIKNFIQEVWILVPGIMSNDCFSLKYCISGSNKERVPDIHRGTSYHDKATPR